MFNSCVETHLSQVFGMENFDGIGPVEQNNDVFIHSRDLAWCPRFSEHALRFGSKPQI
jgi:hypothetical protein